MARKKRRYTRTLFAAVAPRYDRVSRFLSFGRDAAWKRRLLAGLPAFPAPACLDLACGTGDLILGLLSRYPAGRIEGVDLSPEMLALCRQRLPSRAPVRLRVADMNTLRDRAGTYQVISGGYCLRNSPDLPRTLREVRRLLAPGGIAVFLDFARSPNRVLARLQLVLLACWGSFWGWIYHRNPAVYAYLARSLAAFPDRVAFRRLLAESGLHCVRSRRFFFGFIELVWLERAIRRA